MNFREKLAEKLNLSAIGKNTMMDEYVDACKSISEETSIKFALWIMLKSLWRPFSDDAKQWTNGDDIKSIDEVYQIFLEHTCAVASN